MLKKYQLLTTLLWLGVTVVGWIFVLFIVPGYGSAWWWLSFLVLPICEEVVLLMRRRGQFNPYVDTTQLLKISRSRLT